MPLPLLWPAALIQTAPAPGKSLPLPEAESQLIEAYDDGSTLPILKVAARNRPALQWLRSAALDPVPNNPFQKGSRNFLEAEALRSLLASPAETWPDQVKEMPLALMGTRLALWRWGRLQVRTGRMEKVLRLEWENRLLQGNVGRLRGLALRHALSWALAEGDEARFAHLKARNAMEATDLLPGFQNLFGWLGGTSPSLRLWKFPHLAYEDLPLDQLGGQRIWICPVEQDLPSIPPGTVWIIPSQTGGTNPNETALAAADRAEAEALLPRLKQAGLTPWLAPQRKEWEEAGLIFFPILIELEATGRITRIRMGDAAPAAP